MALIIYSVNSYLLISVEQNRYAHECEHVFLDDDFICVCCRLHQMIFLLYSVRSHYSTFFVCSK